jgi:glycosyltransferase involved in cell wall biosynthesis
MQQNISVIILTYNEELNIIQCLENIAEWANEIIVLDSNSNDKTTEIAESFGSKVFYRSFDNYANQRNYALNDIPISNNWILFLDADEWLTEELKSEIKIKILNTSYDGFLIRRRLYFLGKWIKHGGYYPCWNLRLFRNGIARVDREINEHVEVNGKIGKLKNDMVDENNKGLVFWLNKHIGYAQMEARQFSNSNNLSVSLFGNAIHRKNWIRKNIWNKVSVPFIRPFIFFFYSYVLRLGFLDGKKGLLFHFLHGLWYLFLIDTFWFLNKFDRQK